MKVIKYNLELLEPALVTSVQGDPNSSVAFDYLPGSVLRGILIGKYLGSKSADASDDDLHRLFFNGTTRYLNAYPLDVYGRPGLPVPVSWQQAKGDRDNLIFDFAVKAGDDKKQWQPVREPFYTWSDRDVRLIRPKRNIAVHTQRTARFGRAMPEYRPNDNGQASGKLIKLLKDDEIRGAVYRYDALAAGQTFQATIICENDADTDIPRDLIGGHVTLGGSRSGGYGRAQMTFLSVDSDHDKGNEKATDGKLIVTLQSDVLLRDENGQFAVDPQLLGRVLSRYLSDGSREVQLKLVVAFLSNQVIAGFNRKWGLPLPQVLAVRMGSVLVFEDPGCSSTQLHDLEVRGIGERRAEGFGRIIFNRQRIEELVARENEDQKNSDSNNVPFSEIGARTLAKLMVNRMLKKRLDEGLLAAANQVRIVNPPSNAQLSRLRGIVLEELRNEKPNIRKIHQFIKDLQERSISRRQFERSTVNRIPLLRWLERLLMYNNEGTLTMADNVWKDLLRVNEVELDIKIGDEKAEIDNSLRLEYVLRFIDLVLANAAKQRGKEN